MQRTAYSEFSQISKPHLRCLTGFWISLWYFFLPYFHIGKAKYPIGEGDNKSFSVANRLVFSPKTSIPLILRYVVRWVGVKKTIFPHCDLFRTRQNITIKIRLRTFSRLFGTPSVMLRSSKHFLRHCRFSCKSFGPSFFSSINTS